MPALPTPQQPYWNTNVYTLTTIRVVVMILVVCLIRILYNAVPSIWGARPMSVAASVADSIELENVVSDTLATVVPEAGSAGLSLEIDPTLEVRPPRRVHNARNHTETSRANARAQSQGLEASGQPAATQAMPEQEGDLHNSDHHMEEGMDVTASNTRRETSIDSVVHEEIDGTPTQSRGDAIRSSLDA